MTRDPFIPPAGMVPRVLAPQPVETFDAEPEEKPRRKRAPKTEPVETEPVETEPVETEDAED